MNKDNIQGKMDDVKGRVKRQAGEWTGDSKLQAEGAIDQVKGKAQDAMGKVREGAHNMKQDVQDEMDRKRGENEREREARKERKDEAA
ncbi:MAG TPA: CsbD family protein [Burkholderiales bacterium]|nr:CsbD family protein [Burkholderiales bacterium]